MKAVNKPLLSLLCVGSVCLAWGFDWSSVGTELDVPENTVLEVTSTAECDKLATLTRINIPATSELLVRDVYDKWDTSKCTISASLTGGGRLAFSGAGGMVLSGDNRAFTGSFWSSNSCISVTSAFALGTTNSVTHYMGDTSMSKGAFRFGADGVYSNRFHFIEGPLGANMVSRMSGATTVVLRGEILVTGQVSFGNVRVETSIRHDGANGTNRGAFLDTSVRGDLVPDLCLDYGDGVGDIQLFGSANFYWYGGSYVCGRFVICSGLVYFFNGDLVSLSPNASLQFGSDFRDQNGQKAGAFKGALHLSGTAARQLSVSNLLYSAEVTADNVADTSNSISGSKTLRITGCGPSFGWRCQLKDHISILYDSQTASPGTLLLTNPESPTDGSLSVSRGTLVIGEGATFPNVTSVSASGEGILEIRNAAAFSSGAVTLTLEGPDSGAVRIPEGVAVEFDKVVVGGRTMLTGDYFGGQGASGAFKILGGGKLSVKNGAAVSSYYWTGAAEDGKLRTGSNWYPGLPKFDGTEKLFFTSSWCGTKIGALEVSGDIRLCNLRISSSVDVSFVAKDASSRVIFCPNGEDFTDAYVTTAHTGALLTQSGEADVKYTFDVPVAFAPGYGQSWAAGKGVTLKFARSVSGGSPDKTVAVSWYNWNQPSLVLEGDASGLLAPLDISHMKTLSVLSSYGLGATDRVTRIAKDMTESNRVLFSGRGLTNNTPIRLKIDNCYGGINDYHPETLLTERLDDPFVQRGALHLVGSANRMLSIGGYAFEGGLVASADTGAEGEDNIQFYLRTNLPVRLSGGPVQMANADLGFRCDLTADILLSATNNVWRKLMLNNMRLSCEAAGVLCPVGVCQVGTTGWPNGRICLNGFDQTLGTLRLGPDYVVDAESPVYDRIVVESDSPATLSLCPTAVIPATTVSFTNHAALAMNGAAESSWTIARLYSDTDGALTVNSGTLEFKWGAGWGGTNVVVRGGTLKVGVGSGDDVFGRAGKADLSISGSGRLEVEEGVRAVVGAMSVNGQPLTRGRWGGPDCSLVAADHRLSAIAGRGVVKVTKGEPLGMLLLVR